MNFNGLLFDLNGVDGFSIICLSAFLNNTPRVVTSEVTPKMGKPLQVISSKISDK